MEIPQIAPITNTNTLSTIFSTQKNTPTIQTGLLRQLKYKSFY